MKRLAAPVLALLLVLPVPALARRLIAELPGWSLRGPAQGVFTAGADRAVRHGGGVSARLATSSDMQESAYLVQRLQGAAYRGQRVRFAAWVKTADVRGLSGLMMMIEEAGRVVGYDNMQNRPLRGSNEWRRCEIVLDVPPRAGSMTFGLWQEGRGTSWIDDVRLEVVDARVPVTNVDATPDRPLNLDFESGDGSPSAWFVSGGAHDDYAATLQTTYVHAGRRAVLFAPRVAKARGYATLMQEFRADRYRGKRWRASIWVKTEGVTARGDFWVRAQAADSPGDGDGLASGGQPLVARSDWRRYEVVLDVPAEAAAIDIGVGIDGPGRLWVDDARFEEVGQDIPVTDPLLTRPVNLDFEQAHP